MRILIVDDEASARYGMAKALRAPAREILEAESGDEALLMIRQQQPDLVFLDLNMPGRDGLSVLSALQADPLAQPPEILVVTANDTVQHAVESIRRGASDYLTKPYDVEHLRAIARRSEARLQLQRQVTQLQQQLDGLSGSSPILGGSRAVEQLLGQIRRAAQAALPVLIRGESGTGKELVARQLHESGPRAAGPFIAVNTAAMAESLVESELFGHSRGAFTGADRAREGVFRKADGGTLFLDEIGDMPANVQTRLLRVLQEGLVQPVGTEEVIRVDVRVVSATHQDLEQAIADKLFRQDLYFRLRGIELFIPPLRQRREDILPLAVSFMGGQHTLTAAATAALVAHHWPGNVRELKQRIESAVAMAESNSIDQHDLGLMCQENVPASDDPFEAYYELPLAEAREKLIAEFERLMIQRALGHESGNISAAARRLGMHRQSLQQKMKQLGL